MRLPDEIKTAAVVVAGLATLGFSGWLVFGRTAVETDQIGFRGVAMEQGQFADDRVALAMANVAPEEIYEASPDDGTSDRAYQIYENVQVLGHLSDDNFNRIMAQITEWVSPEQGCAYCHGEEGNFASDDYYPKVVARRMIQMTQTINSEWGQHVAPAGVNCYTCHRGQNVPQYLWFLDEETETAGTRFIGERNGQNHPVAANGYTSLNAEPFSAYLLDDNVARVQDLVPITSAAGATIQDTEAVYSLMINWSRSLGVNCTYCHNSRAFGSWEQSPPTRSLAWHGKQMVQAVNTGYLVDLGPVYPENRLGPLGDAPKAYCATCHQGANKPLAGADMISLYPSLAAPGPAEQQDPPTGLTAQ